MADNINAEAMALLNKFIGYELLQKEIATKLMDSHGIEIEATYPSGNVKFIRVKQGIDNFGRETMTGLSGMKYFSAGGYTIFQTTGGER